MMVSRPEMPEADWRLKQNDFMEATLLQPA